MSNPLTDELTDEAKQRLAAQFAALKLRCAEREREVKIREFKIRSRSRRYARDHFTIPPPESLEH